ncbi:glutaredoxin 3 [Ectothiorhodospira shaposhnikovii]|nr:glutaredoxin 3 [Ectothiorhodospira shaposhnikovii]MBK1672870.1 glutaredoxin 3 [Ectothiorhodospira shaposhnikovii]
MYGTGSCAFCMLARRLLKGKGVSFDEIRVDQDPAQRELMERRSGRETVPQVFAGDRHLGGYTDLVELDRRGELDVLLGLVSD